MPLPRSPTATPTGQKVQESDVTLKMVFESVTSQLKDIQAGQASIISRLDKMEIENEKLKKSHEAIKSDLSTFKAQVGNDFNFISDKIEEEVRKIRKMCNIIIMGISEDDEGNNILIKLLEVISPGKYSELNLNERLGELKQGTNRPVRIRFSTQMERDSAMKNCKQLKNHPEFAKVSVRKDLTKYQQQQQKTRSPVVTRGSISKRKHDDSAISTMQKFPRYSNSYDTMELDENETSLHQTGK